MRTEEDRITVLFDEVGYKTLSLSAVEESQLLRLDQHRGHDVSAVQPGR